MTRARQRRSLKRAKQVDVLDEVKDPAARAEIAELRQVSGYTAMQGAKQDRQFLLQALKPRKIVCR